MASRAMSTVSQVDYDGKQKSDKSQTDCDYRVQHKPFGVSCNNISILILILITTSRDKDHCIYQQVL